MSDFLNYYIEQHKTMFKDSFEDCEDTWNHQQKRIDELEGKLRKIKSITENMGHKEFVSDYGKNAAMNIAAEINVILRGDQ